MKAVLDKVVSRINRRGRGFVFVAKDFLDLGSRGSIDMALAALAKNHRIRRICRGVYDYPKQSQLLGVDLVPDFDQVAQAISRNVGARIQPSEAVAANLLGLSQQVPAKIVYLSDRLNRSIKIEQQTITFRRVHPKELLRNPMSARVVQALRFLGKEAVTPDTIQKLQQILNSIQRKRLLKDARYTSAWITEVARRIVDEANHG